jgi:drug/metabolite transporter (DMT)-like permease
MQNATIRGPDAFLLIIMILFWGSSFVIVKIALGEGLTPISIATFRFLVAGSLFILALVFNKARNRDYRLSIDKREFPSLVLLALTGVTFFFAAQYTGIKLASASLAAILVCFLSPILIAALSAYIYKESLSRRQILGISTAAAGTLVVIAEGSLAFSGGGNQYLTGTLILLCTPALWAIYSLVGKSLIAKHNPFVIVAYVNVLGGIFLVPFSLAENSLTLVFSMSMNSLLAILFLSITCSFIGYSIWFHELNHVKAAVTSSFLFVEPLVTVTFAIVFIGEKMSIFTILGALLIFFGVLLVSAKRNLPIQHQQIS